MAVLSILLAVMLQSGLFTVEIHQNVTYARSRGYWCETRGRDDNFAAQALRLPKAWWERDIDLKMDIYRPHLEEGPLPLVMLMHGGAFFANSKESMPVSLLCRDLAERGCVAVSIDYRMGFNLHRKSVRRAEEYALEDARCALHFLTENAESYGIDTSCIFVGGASSGAITTLRLAASEKECNIMGVIDMWGAVDTLELLDDTDVALIAFHGDRDDTVPYNEGWPMGGKLLMSYMYGSKPLVEHLQERGRDARLVSFEGYAHAPYRDSDHSTNANLDTIRTEVVAFVGKFVHLRP